ncbi:YdeI/OmpD-associated family protein [Pedobacter glucosidilyticus]|uniref:YdeI/OmpD-associated family protein n=1 Tax=Pedobacter glucosidilyticus TaxID=1122941 RepID=UPI000403FBC0|nr:YdeI/OmpD-associated family protein [Pedobacter glucosidilyticus]
MITFDTLIKKYGKMGDKTGWTYIDIPKHIAAELKPFCKVSFRVKGEIDHYKFSGLALLPVGDGDYILPLKQAIRKAIAKESGAMVKLSLAEDIDFKIEIPEDLKACLAEQDTFTDHFMKLSKAQRNYFINWINEAKTDPTREKRLMQTVKAMEYEMDFGAMIRSHKANRNEL